MKINKQKSSRRKKLITSLVAAVLLALAIGGILYATNTYPFDKSSEENAIDYDEPTDEQKDQGEQAKEDTINPASSDNNSNEQNIPKEESSGQSQSPDDGLSTVITAKDTDDKNLYIRSETQGIYAEGSCTLTLQGSGKTITKTAGVQALPQSTTCKGFNVPLSELSSGKYAITLDVSAGGKKSTTKSEVTI